MTARFWRIALALLGVGLLGAMAAGPALAALGAVNRTEAVVRAREHGLI